MKLKYNRFVVCDEFGPLRAFWDRDEAVQFLHGLIDSDVDAELIIRAKPERPDLTYLGEALF